MVGRSSSIDKRSTIIKRERAREYLATSWSSTREMEEDLALVDSSPLSFFVSSSSLSPSFPFFLSPSLFPISHSSSLEWTLLKSTIDRSMDRVKADDQIRLDQNYQPFSPRHLDTQASGTTWTVESSGAQRNQTVGVQPTVLQRGQIIKMKNEMGRGQKDIFTAIT